MSASNSELVSPFLEELTTCLTQGIQGKILVVVIKVISDAAFAKMVQGIVWRGRKERINRKSKGEGRRTTTYFKSPLPMEAETPLRSGFKSFDCSLTALPIHELAEHSHGINIKSLLKWNNFKWPRLICAVTHFKWTQCIFFVSLVNAQSWILFPCLYE